MKSRTTALLALAAVAVSTTPASALTYTCATVAREGFLDTVGSPFTRKFEEPAVNGSGTVVFKGRNKNGIRGLYLYRNPGADERIAFDGSAAPGGSTFKQFDSPSINDAGTIAFFGDLDVGQGVFRHAAGVLSALVRSGDTSPSGGTFFEFHQVARINAGGDVAFIAEVTSGPDGVFLWDESAGQVVTVALEEAATTGGREVCGFVDIELGDSGNAAFHATSRVDCTDTGEPLVHGIFRMSGAAIHHVALAGDPSPLGGGAVYNKFYEVNVNAGDGIGFRAKSTTVGGEQVYLFDPAGPSTTLLVRTGDAAPGTATGTIKNIPHGWLTDLDQSAFRGKVKGDTVKHGIFLFDGVTEAVVLNTTPVPDDSWGMPATYRNIDEAIGVSRSSTQVAFSAKVKDNTATPSGTGLFLCTGV
jgi:hypothetical protein